jgi:thiol-disulfide isomerase/thioredoxin
MRIDRLMPLAALVLALTTAPVRAESGALDLAKYRGKVVLVDFWASWCAPCKQAFPALAKLSHDHRAQDLVVITINEERQRPAGEAFLRQVQSRLPVIWDSAGSIGKSWTVNEMPTTLLFDRKGKLRYRHQGFVAGSAAEYAGQIDALIKEH